jgi:signal transduction histidine kinase/ligand-binding sensor domain-containing protein
VWAAVSLCPAAALAQPVRTLTGYTATLWADVDGNPVGTVSAIAQDGDGYLWVGTTAGLFRFDGVRFTAWSQIGDTTLPTTAVSSLCVTADGSLWVGYNDRPMLARVRGRSAQLLTLPGDGPIGGIAEDADGVLWVVAAYSLLRVTGDSWKPVPLPSDRPRIRVQNVGVSRGGRLLVSTNLGIFERHSRAPEFIRIVSGNVWSAVDDRDGRLWITDAREGFRVIDAGKRAQSVSTILGGGYRVMADARAQVWVGTTAEGLWHVRLREGGRAIIEKATLRSALFNDSVQALFEDRQGNIWVGTTAGLHRLHRQLLETIPTHGIVGSIDGNVPGELWAGTPRGLVRLRPGDGGWTPTLMQPTGGPIRGIARDSTGALWLASGDRRALGRYQGGRLEWIHLPPRFQISSRVAYVAVGPRDLLWFGDGSQVLQWNGRTFSAFAPRAGDGTPPIRRVYPDRLGRVWIALADGRLAVHDAAGEFRILKIDALLPNQSTILSIGEGNGGRIWVATSRGLIRAATDATGERPVLLGRGNGLPVDLVWTAVEDDDGSVWADIGAGIIRVQVEEFDRLAVAPDHQVNYDFYDASDGLSGAPTVTARAGRTSDGKVWFIRSGAVTLADPHVLRQTPNDELAPVVIDNVRANERTFAGHASLSLAPGTTRVELDYATVALSQPTRVRYRHRLDGVDSNWVAAGVRRTAAYTNLRPGKYRFRVQAGSNEDGWQPAHTTYEFEIRPAFYQTTAFFYAALLLAGALVLTAWRMRVRLVQRQYAAVLAERMRLSREIHDTLLQGVVGVTLQLSNVSRDPNLPAASKARLQETRDVVEAYIREARQSILDLRSPLLEEHDLVGALREAARRATANTSTELVVHVTGQPKRYAARLENELLRIAQEAVTNAVRHAQAAHVTLTLRFEPGRVSVEVSDDGRGLSFSTDDLEPTHIGLDSMKERAESLGGRVRIRRSGHGGTTIEASLPVQGVA